MSKRTNLVAALHNAGAKTAKHQLAASSGISNPVAARPRPSADSTRPASRAGQRVVTFYVKPEAHKQLRLMGVEGGANVQELMIEALNDLFSKYGKSRIA